MTLYDRIAAHLATGPTARVRLGTRYRYTDLAPKHLPMLRPSTRHPEHGIDVQHGRQWLTHLDTDYVGFGRIPS